MDRNGIPDRFRREIRPSTKHYISDTYINTKRVCLTFSMRTQKWKRSAHVNSHLETSIFKHVWTCFDLHPISSWHTDPLKWKLVREKGLGRIPGGIGKWMGVKTMNFRCETWFAQHLLEPNSESMCQQKTVLSDEKPDQRCTYITISRNDFCLELTIGASQLFVFWRYLQSPNARMPMPMHNYFKKKYVSFFYKPSLTGVIILSCMSRDLEKDMGRRLPKSS